MDTSEIRFETSLVYWRCHLCLQFSGHAFVLKVFSACGRKIGHAEHCEIRDRGSCWVVSTFFHIALWWSQVRSLGTRSHFGVGNRKPSHTSSMRSSGHYHPREKKIEHCWRHALWGSIAVGTTYIDTVDVQAWSQWVQDRGRRTEVDQFPWVITLQ